MSSTIELKGVCLYKEDGEVVFDGLDFELSAGEKVLVTGPVASGKGVLVRLLAGTVKPDSGSVIIFGTEAAGLDDEEMNPLRRRMGFVTKGNILISNLKVIENVALPLLYHSELSYDESMERAMELLIESGFTGDPWQLSGPLPPYHKKEVAVARALSMSPDLVVCESISEGLREAEIKCLLELLLKYHADSDERMLLFTAKDDYGAGIMRPDRILRLDGHRLVQ